MSPAALNTVIETLADELAAARALISSLREDIDVYRTIALEAVARVSELGQQLEVLDRRRDVYRRHTDQSALAHRQEAA